MEDSEWIKSFEFLSIERLARYRGEINRRGEGLGAEESDSSVSRGTKELGPAIFVHPSFHNAWDWLRGVGKPNY